MTRPQQAPKLRDPAVSRAPRGRHDGRLNAECWRQCAVVPVEPHDLQDGRTESCGRTWCTPPIGVS